MNLDIRTLATFVASAAAAAVCAACGDSSDGGSEQPGASGAAVRLADLLEVAAIRSPLTEVTAASGLDQLVDIPTQTIFSEDFEDVDQEQAGWPLSPPGELVPSERGTSFRWRGGSGQERRSWTLPAESNTYYVFERSVRSKLPLVADFQVFEVSTPMTFDALLEKGRGAPELLSRVHTPQAAAVNGTWQSGSVSFYTGPYTKALVVVLWPIPTRHGEPTLADTVDDPEAWFDEVRVSRLEPTPEQSIALLKPRDLAANATPALGMRKRGQFPPLPAPGGARRPREDNYSFRYALYAPPPTDLGFPVSLGPDSVLRFSTCLSRETRLGHAARFEVLVVTEDEEQSLWSETLTAVPESWKWHEVEVDLSAFAGRSVTLALRTRAVTGAPHPMWGQPVVSGPYAGEGPANVILIAVDTLRANRLSSYGYEKPTSPRLDQFAEEGVRFENVVSNSTWTCPSFASIFSGVVPSKHGAWVSGSFWGGLPGRLETLAERFRGQGWATHAIAYKTPLYSSGYDQGFDVSFNTPKSDARADDNLAKALEWLESNADRRNFLFLHFNDPHQPFSQPAPYVETFGPVPDRIHLPFNVEGTPKFQGLREATNHLYDGEIAYVDDRIGAFLDELQRRGLYDDAVILFVSDHGEELWEHGGFGHSRGKLYDEAIRVPLIVKPVRGSYEPGTVVATQVSAFDVMPTLLELAGLPVTDELDAESLVPLLTPNGSEEPDRLAITETWNGGIALRTRRWKYMTRIWREPGSSEALYDLEVDPREHKNVARERPDIAAHLRVLVFDYLMRHRPGHYVVAIGEGTGGSYDHLVRGVVDATTIHGVPHIQVGGPDVAGGADPGAVRLRGEASGALVVVAQVETAGPVHIGPEGVEPRGFNRYSAGELERLLREGAVGVHLFEGPPPPVEDASRELESMDPVQVEALRALGYVGDD